MTFRVTIQQISTKRKFVKEFNALNRDDAATLAWKSLGDDAFDYTIVSIHNR